MHTRLLVVRLTGRRRRLRRLALVHERELDLDLRVVGDTQADLLRELELEVAPLNVELSGHLERVAVPARLEGKRTFREIPCSVTTLAASKLITSPRSGDCRSTGSVRRNVPLNSPVPRASSALPERARARRFSQLAGDRL